MTPELSNYFDMMEALFGEPGWAQVVKDAQQELLQLQYDLLDKGKDEKDLYFAKGQADVLARIITLRKVTEVTKAQHEEQDEYDADL